MFPSQLAASVTGLPVRKARGKKGKGRPGSAHLTALQKAHGAGDFPAARKHALNYAKSTMGVGEPDQDEMGGPSDMDADNAMVRPAIPPAPKSPPKQQPMSMARLAMGRRPK